MNIDSPACVLPAAPESAGTAATEVLSGTAGVEAADVDAGPVAYIMSRFPKITETFVLYELLAVERLGRRVEVYPLLRESAAVMHPEAEVVVRRAHYTPFVSWQVVRSNGHFLRRRPGAYFKALGAVLKGTWGSANFFFGGLALFPKIVAFAHSMEVQGVTHVHAHFCNHPALAAFVIRRLTGIPYSFTAHGSDLHRDRHMLCDKVREAAWVATVSEYNRELIIAECGTAARDKVQVIHCGVDIAAFRPAADEVGTGEEEPSGHVEDAARRSPSPAPPLNVVCVGTLHEVKGQRFLLEAVDLLRRRGVEIDCHLIGDGEDRARLTELAQRLGISDRVHFHGACVRAQVIARLRNCDVVVAPSVPTKDGRREGIPVALMEAMACGAAVVASRLSGIPELVEHGRSGLLTPPGDAPALAEALARLAGDEELRKRLAREARQVIEDDFNLQANAERLLNQFAAASGAPPTPEPRLDTPLELCDEHRH